MAVNDPKTAVDKFFDLQFSTGGVLQPLRRQVDVAGATFTDDPVNQILHMSVAGSSPVNGQTNLTLTNGLNSNINIGDLPVGRAGGPTAAFSVGGFAPTTVWRGGQRIVFVNTTAQVCTIVNEDLSSTATNRINIPNATPIVLLPRSASIEFVYDSTINRFLPVHTGFRYDSVVNARDFGARGDGSTDDSAALDAATAASFALRKPLYLPAGVYIRNSPWSIIPPAPFTPFRMFGDGGAQAGQAHTTVRAGPSFPLHGVLVTVGDPSTFLNNAEFTHITFDGNQRAVYCCQVVRFTDATMFNNCGFILPTADPYWLPNTAYTTGSPPVIPWEDNGHRYQCTTNGTSTNATNSPGSGGGTRSPVFNTGSGSTTNDNGTVWTEIGPSGACLVIGDGTGQEADLVMIHRCIFNGAGGIVPGSPLNPVQTVITGTSCGVRFLGGVNAKDFSISESFWTDCGRGFDFSGAGGQVTVKFCGGGSTECDFFVPGSIICSIHGTSSEGSACIVKGDVGASTAYTPLTIIGGLWDYAGGVFAQGPTFGCAIFGNFNLNIHGCTFVDTGGTGLNTTLASSYTQPSPGFNASVAVTAGAGDFRAAYVGQRIFIAGGGYYKIATITDNQHALCTELNEAGNSGGLAGGNTVPGGGAVLNAQEAKIAGSVGTGVPFSYFGSSNSFFNATRLPIFDTGFGLAAINGDASSFVGLINGNGGTKIVSQNEGGTDPSNGNTVTFGNYSGTPFRPGVQQYLDQIGQTIDPGVQVTERGRLVTMQRRFTIPYTSLIANATTMRLGLGNIWPDYRILAVYAKVTAGFTLSGGAPSVQVGRFQVTAIIRTDNAYLLDKSITSVGVIGASGGDLGADLASPVQGAAAYFGADYPASTEDQLTALFTSGGGSLGNGNTTNLTTGSLDIIVIYQKL